MWIENSVLHLSYYVHKFSPFSHFFFAAKNSYNHSFIQCFDSFRSIRAFCDLPLYINLAFGSIALVHWMLTITSPPPLPRSECTPRIMGSSFRIHSIVKYFRVELDFFHTRTYAQPHWIENYSARRNQSTNLPPPLSPIHIHTEKLQMALHFTYHLFSVIVFV